MNIDDRPILYTELFNSSKNLIKFVNENEDVRIQEIVYISGSVYRLFYWR